jgi:hypothetical protein
MFWKYPENVLEMFWKCSGNILKRKENGGSHERQTHHP